MSNQENQSSKDETLEQLKALGYIDPGAGSSMWQIVLAGFFAVSSKIKNLFKKIFSSRNPENLEE
ncbi:MAG: hypothetical protein AAB946_00885 [Patescibacteria group bacterium]